VPKKLIEIRLWGTTDKRAKNAVEVCIHRLRKRLATAAASVRVRTIHRVGYFISE
jgi:DNA-binding response OmpR family regulator